jgi:hypothetical protein
MAKLLCSRAALRLAGGSVYLGQSCASGPNPGGLEPLADQLMKLLVKDRDSVFSMT